MVCSEIEAKIILTFFRNLRKYQNENMLLIWNNKGQITAEFDTCFDDDNDLDDDEEGYEEFNSFVFKALTVEGTPPVTLTHENYFLLNYHNFPDEILVDGKKIN